MTNNLLLSDNDEVSSPHFMYQFDLESQALAGAYSVTDTA